MDSGVVGVAGFEPARLSAGDFESPESTIPTRPRGGRRRSRTFNRRVAIYVSRLVYVRLVWKLSFLVEVLLS